MMTFKGNFVGRNSNLLLPYLNSLVMPSATDLETDRD